MTASFDVTRCSRVLAELIRSLCRCLTLDSKGIRESRQYGRRGIALVVEATREARSITRDYGKSGASSLG